MSNFLRAVVAFALVSAGSTASAAAVDLGTIAPGDFAGGALLFSSPNAIDDDWTFTIDTDLATAISVDSNDSDPFFGISGFTVSSADAGLAGEFVYDAADNAWSFAGDLMAGTYVIDVTGDVSGDFAGQYNVLVGTMVPVPAAFLLFGSALMGLVAVKRRQSAA